MTRKGHTVTLCPMLHGPLRYITRVLPPLLLSMLITPSYGEDIRQLTVKNEAGRYTVIFEVMLNAPVEKTLPLMVDPANWPRLADIVSASEVIEDIAADKKKVHIIFEGCVLFICKTLKKTEIMRLLPQGEITTLALPEASDFLYASERWHITGVGQDTRVEYQAELVPDFFVPPVIGPYILKLKIQSLLTQTAHNLERLAH